MSAKWNTLKVELFAGHPICKLCRVRPAVHLHHAIINKGKVRSKRLHKYLDHKYNSLEVCGKCHLTADRYEVRQKAWTINCERYGRSSMEAWYSELPLKIKEMFE